MKKLLTLFPILLTSFSLISCNNEKENVGYHIVEFNYNHETNNTVYTSLVVPEGAVINAPKDPTINGYLFAGWYKEANCINEYKRWGLEIDSNFTLYAKWESLETADAVTKINALYNNLDDLGKNAVKVTQDVEAIVGYPGVISGEDGVFGVKDRYIYNRYKNITVKDYYQYQEDQSLTNYGKEQFFYDNQFFYDVYVDYEDDKNNEVKTADFKESNVEKLLSIDYLNLNGAQGTALVNYIESGKYNEETLDYELECDLSKLDGKDNFTYSITYGVADYDEKNEVWITHLFYGEYGIVFNNNRIASVNCNTKYQVVLDDTIMQYEFATSIYEFYYNDNGFSDFTGEILPH